MRDLCFLDTTTDKVVPVPFTITGECTGRAQLAQRLLTMLLRSIDDPARVDATGIAQRVGKSNVLPSGEQENAFTLALANVQEIISNDQGARTDLTDDETLSSLRLESLTSQVDTVDAVIAIITVSGDEFYTSFTI